MWSLVTTALVGLLQKVWKLSWNFTVAGKWSLIWFNIFCIRQRRQRWHLLAEKLWYPQRLICGRVLNSWFQCCQCLAVQMCMWMRILQNSFMYVTPSWLRIYVWTAAVGSLQMKGRVSKTSCHQRGLVEFTSFVWKSLHYVTLHLVGVCPALRLLLCW